MFCRGKVSAALISTVIFISSICYAQNYIVKNGIPEAEIITAENPPASVKFAAEELQAYIKKISGAELIIKTRPALSPADGKVQNLFVRHPVDEKDMPVKIYIGESWHTDRLKVTDKGLEYGAYRIQSGKNFLVLLGRDRDFTPIGVWGRSRGDWNTRGINEWDKAAGHKWVTPLGQSMYRWYNKELDMWSHDERGSLNAVYSFIRSLGVRWYMPGELGEIVPEKKQLSFLKLTDLLNRIINTG